MIVSSEENFGNQLTVDCVLCECDCVENFDCEGNTFLLIRPREEGAMAVIRSVSSEQNRKLE